MMVLISCIVFGAVAEEGHAKREAYLEQLLRVLPESAAWEAWLRESGELPPDFSAMPSCPFLPDPLLRQEAGEPRPITSVEEWNAQRTVLRELFHKWVLGTVPPAPASVEAVVLEERQEGGCRARKVELVFGEGGVARLHVELLIPKGAGPFPVFMTQENHRGWALIALRRGYLACTYAACDLHDDTDSFVGAYPGYDWSRLTRRAWAASRAVDYLASVPEADVHKVALTGHSRNGKQSLIAAALDDRIAVVISSSAGQGGSLTTRYYSELDFGEGIESITRVFPNWFHPRLRFFVGREDRLPVDMHELAALCAPRPCLLSCAYNDGCGSAWAEQQTYLAAKPVYELHGAADKLRILWRPGGHAVAASIVERYLDWCDTQFGRQAYAFPERLLYPWDWDSWRDQEGTGCSPPATGAVRLRDLFPPSGPPAITREQWPEKRLAITYTIREMMGDAPPEAEEPGGNRAAAPEHVRMMLGRNAAGDGLQMADCRFGEDINGYVYFPDGFSQETQKASAIIWLHPFSFPNGYGAAYRRGDQAYQEMARAGYVTFCFDQIGCGERVEEIEGFYERHPRWSLLGKMVRDTQSAIDAVLRLPYVDQHSVWLVGFGLGGFVGLYTAALDDRIAGVVSVCGAMPYDTTPPSAGDAEIARWSRLHMVLPRIGFWIGRKERPPYGIAELLACIAPKSVLLVSPALDHDGGLEGLSRQAEAARKAYRLLGNETGIHFQTPEDYPNFGPEAQQNVLDWLRKCASKERSPTLSSPATRRSHVYITPDR